MTNQIPADIVEAVIRMGKVEWGAVGPKSDAEHVADFTDTLAITRETFGFTDARYLHGLYLEGSETVLCHTGTSPNSAPNARALAGAWNWLVDAAMQAAAPPPLDDPEPPKDDEDEYGPDREETDDR